MHQGRPSFAKITVPSFAEITVLFHSGQTPQLSRDENGVQYLLTKGGNKLIVGEDPEGRVYFVDTNGNFYYDSGDPELGFYLVRQLKPSSSLQRVVDQVGRMTPAGRLFAGDKG